MMSFRGFHHKGTFLFLKNNPAACPDAPTDNKNSPVFPKNNFIIKAHHPITPTIVCQRGPRDRTESRTKKGAGNPNPAPAGKTGTVRLPAYKAGNVPARMPGLPPVVRRIMAPGKKRRHTRIPIVPGRTEKCPAIPNTITK